MANARTVPRRIAASVAVAITVAYVAVGVATPAAGTDKGSGVVTELVGGVLRALIPACSQPRPGHRSCNALILRPTASAAAAPSGLTPSAVASAYKLPRRGGVVAVVDAFDDPRAASDLASYRAHFRLPACTTANGCFRKLNQSGVAGAYPAPDAGWAVEISLDLDTVSATCPLCKIVLVEARDDSAANLAAAVDTAARQHPNSISNSYGGDETADERGVDSHYHHPGIAITVASGDGGYGVEYPAASPYVTAVGGTTLVRSSGARGWSETAWGTPGGLFASPTGTGSGCSTYEPKPSWQRDTGCARRTVTDVAAVADPATGLAVYDSYREPGWLQLGGTSLSTQLIAAVYAMAPRNTALVGAQLLYAHRSALFDVTSGTNGQCATGLLGLGPNSYLCQAQRGYDGPTGLGTPNGIGAF
jgi:subtilase family serine protease